MSRSRRKSQEVDPQPQLQEGTVATQKGGEESPPEHDGPSFEASAQEVAEPREQAAFAGGTLENNPKLKRLRGELLSSREIWMFCTQLQLLFSAGASVTESIAVMARTASRARMQRMLSGLSQQLSEGKLFYEVLYQSSAFPDYLCDMIALAERSGYLEEILSHLSNYYEQESALTRGAKRAIRYPAGLFLCILGGIAAVLYLALPFYRQVVARLTLPQNAVGVVLLRVAEHLGTGSWILFLVVAVLALVFWIIGRRAIGRKILYWMFFWLPAVGEAGRKLSRARVACALELMLAAGYDDRQAVLMAERFGNDPGVRAALRSTKKEVMGGAPLAEALYRSRIFSGLEADTLWIGFLSENPTLVLSRLSSCYDAEANEQLENMVSGLEGFLTALLSLSMLVLAATLLLPMIGMLSSL